jgi:histidyl-tRNA synthetase
MGVERLIALIKESGGEPLAPAPDVHLVHQGDEASRLAFRVAEGLRDHGIDVLLHCGGGSFKSQMKKRMAVVQTSQSLLAKMRPLPVRPS